MSDPSPPMYQFSNAPAPAMNTASLLAMPSMPSMKLKRLIAHTIARTANTRPAQISAAPGDPLVCHVTPPITATAMAAAAKWTTSRARAGKVNRSSRAPTPATASAPNPSAAASRGAKPPARDSHRSDAMNTATIAAPPPRGVGRVWELRSEG